MLELLNYHTTRLLPHLQGGKFVVFGPAPFPLLVTEPPLSGEPTFSVWFG